MNYYVIEYIFFSNFEGVNNGTIKETFLVKFYATLIVCRIPGWQCVLDLVSVLSTLFLDIYTLIYIKAIYKKYRLSLKTIIFHQEFKAP